MITDEKKRNLEAKMKKLGIFEYDLTERFIRGSGSGGQKINKTSICVFLRHEPTGLEVKCQRTRSQTDNRFFARRLLCDKLSQLIEGKRSAEQKRREKIRRQKRKRSKRAKDKMLADKKHRSKLKSLRSKPTNQD